MSAERSPTQQRLFAEAAVAAGLVAAAYAWLLSPIMVDDVQRYIEELGANRFFWDLGHVWMQPLALLVHRLTGGALGIIGTLEAVNVASVALGCGVFFELLRRCGHGALRSALATALVAVSFNLVVLGPTAHIKLMVFPPLALALRHAVLWERAVDEGTPWRWHAVASGVWLGVAANFLVSVLPAGVVLAAAMAVKLRGQQGAWRPALARVLPYGAALALSGAAALGAAYLTARWTDSTTATDLLGFVFGGLKEKQDLHVGFAGWKETPFRFVYSLVNNFAYLPSIGPLGRAWLWGMLPDVSAVAASLAWQAAVSALSCVALAAIVVPSLARLRQPRAGLLAAVSYVAGATAFSAYYNLNDPEHWFQFTLPLVFLAVHLRIQALDRLVLGLWLATLAVVNLGAYGVPKALFDLEGRQADLQRQLGPQGLYVGYAAYPGEPDSSLFDSPGVERFRIDLIQLNPARGDTAQLLKLLDARIEAAFARGGRVLVFRALDPHDWRGPVMQVALGGLQRDQLRRHLAERYAVTGPITVGGFPAWEIKPRSR